MAQVIFFEKPGCQGNQRQKALLAAAGHTVHARSLKAEAWTAEGLIAFLGRLPVPEWFNRSAPAIKLGQIDPDALDVRQALSLLLENPLLIRRPLMQVGDERMVGFDTAAVDAWIGLRTLRANALRIFARGEAAVGPEALVYKYAWSNWHRRLGELAMDVMGTAGDLQAEEDPLRRLQQVFFFSRADTIYAGTNEIQLNIIAERGLGMPRG